MRAITANVSGELVKEHSYWTTLYHIFIPSGETSINIRLVSPHKKNITFSGEIYTAFPIQHGKVKSNNKSEIDRTTLTIPNINLAMSAYAEQNNLNGSRVDINKIYLDPNGQPPANNNDFFSIFNGHIEEINYDETALQATIVSKLDIPFGQFPRRTYQRSCNWTFKSVECNYSGERTVCSKTTTDCIIRANIARYGGFPFSVN
jgi:lambda family phage minor tail protein L